MTAAAAHVRAGAAHALRVAVCGAGSASAEETRLAHEVGRRLAEAGAVVVCGGLGGVMEAAARGAVEGGGECVGVLPGLRATDANAFVTLPLPTGMGEMRNMLIVRFADALIAVGGEWGTLSELAFAMKTGTPAVLLAPAIARDLPVPVATDAADAVRSALAAGRRRRDHG